MGENRMTLKCPEGERGIRHTILRLRSLVDDLDLTESVVSSIFPSGNPHTFETELWDYKEELPTLAVRPSAEERKEFGAALGDIIKDVVAFHNAYGGYIIFGVANAGEDRVRGCVADLDCGEFNKRIQGYTNSNIECLFRRMPVSREPGTTQVGILLVPRRAAGIRPVGFVKDGPERPSGGRSFQKATYVRVRDECRPAASTSEDWQFLHSDRSPPDSGPGLRRRIVQSFLPARDPDLIEFVGRGELIAELRNWILDVRSPVRLVTGIGGLGKTALAFRFSEEVVATGAGEVECVIWITGKQQTYSALRGRMVATSGADFDDVASLYRAILAALSYELPVEDEAPTLDDLSERVQDALGFYSCLIVVDDLDSLHPDRQREAVGALNALALRTVGRDLPPSRVLMTSRIDQGLPLTAVIKVSGLDRLAFDKHVSNLCKAFQIGQIIGSALDDLFDATSGSPLFAASIVRLVKIGESLTTVVSTWHGQEGEEVRRFAFEREVQRLDVGQGRLLYAILLLSETSARDLAQVLDLTATLVRDRISELQAYHLIATTIRDSGDTIIFAPSDLVAIKEILRRHLGPHASGVEEACAAAQERSKGATKAIGLGIRTVLDAWDSGRYAEAVIIAVGLRKRFPESGDVASILGAALLRTAPPRIKEADQALDEARRLGCNRPELLPNVITAKTELQDWPGLYDLTKSMNSRNPGRDISLDAFLLASNKLVSLAKVRGDDGRAANLALAVVERLTGKFSHRRLESSYFESLNRARFDFAREYLGAVERLNPRPGDKLKVFEAVVRLAAASVILLDLLRKGLSALQTWWLDVEQRPVIDRTACAILSNQLRRLERIQKQIEGYGVATPAILSEISKTSRDLAFRGAQISDELTQ